VILTKQSPKLVQIPPRIPRAVRDERILAHCFPQPTSKTPCLVDLVARSIAKGLPPSFELDELRGAGNLGLLHAAENYQPTSKMSFATYARAKINHAIWDYLRRAEFFNATMEPLSALHLVDRAETADRKVEHREARDAVNQAVASLPAQQAKVIQLVCIQGAGVVNAGKRLGVHHSHVVRIRQAAMPNLRKHFALRGRTGTDG